LRETGGEENGYPAELGRRHGGTRRQVSGTRRRGRGRGGGHLQVRRSGTTPRFQFRTTWFQFFLILIMIGMRSQSVR
jgi:hypothetical protein